MLSKFAAFPALFLTFAPALAGEIEVPSGGDGALSISVYASGNALVQEQRRVQLPEGQSQLMLEGVSPSLNPATAWLSGARLRVRSLDFLFDTLSPQTLVSRSLGKTVEVIRNNPATGAVVGEPATILSVRDGVVLKVGDKIEAGMPERMAFAQLPPGLRAEPALLADVVADKAGGYDLSLAYQTGGLGWKAVYAVVLGDKAERLDLDGNAILTNVSGVRFKNAAISLLAGDIKRVAERQPAPFEEMQAFDSSPAPRVMMAKAAAPMASIAEEDFATGRAFRLPDPVTLEINQTKQVRLLSEEGVKTSRDYLLDYGFDPASARFDAARPHESRPEVALQFDVPKDRSFLPAGVARVYQKSKSGELQLLGEDRMKGAAAGEKVKLSLGRAYDVSAKWRQTEYGMQQNKQTVFEGDVAWEVELSNARKDETSVKISQPMANQWTILDSSHPYQKASARQAEWLVKIPAEGKTVLKVRAHFKN